MTRYGETFDVYHPYRSPAVREVSPDSAFRPFPNWVTDYDFHGTAIYFQRRVSGAQQHDFKEVWIAGYDRFDHTFHVCTEPVIQDTWDREVHHWTVPERVAFRNFPYHAVAFLHRRQHLSGPNDLTARFGDWFPWYLHDTPQYPYPPMPWTAY